MIGGRMKFIEVGDCSRVMEKCSHFLSTTRLLSQNSHVIPQEVEDLYADVCYTIFLDIRDCLIFPLPRSYGRCVQVIALRSINLDKYFLRSFKCIYGLYSQPPIQWVPRGLSSGVKRPGREADHSQTSADVKKMWLYTSAPPYAFIA
jgi:hypothetical protein